MCLQRLTKEGKAPHPVEEGRHGKQVGIGDPGVLCGFACAVGCLWAVCWSRPKGLETWR